MLKNDLIFGRENIAYAVIAAYSDAVNEKPVVVSLHLSAKFAHAHRLQMQSHSRNVRFLVRKVRITGGIDIIEDSPPESDRPQQQYRTVIRRSHVMGKTS